MRPFQPSVPLSALPSLLQSPRSRHWLRRPPQLRPLLAHAPANLGVHSVALDAAAGRAVSWDEAARALVAGFELAWGAELAPGSLTPDERATEAELLDKYAAQIGGVGEHGFPTSPKRIGEWV